MKCNYKFNVIIILALSLAILSGCATTTTTGGTVNTDRQQLMLLSSEQLDQMDAKVYANEKTKEEATVVLRPDEPHQSVSKNIEIEPVDDFTPIPSPAEVPAKIITVPVTIEQTQQNNDPLIVTDQPPVEVLSEVPAKIITVPVTIEQTQKNDDPPTVVEKTEPPLDMAAMKTRLRDTDAIGVFTKLVLKNQMDDLMKKFQAYHQGSEKTSITTLRQPYDMLLLKLLAVIQDGDPTLARTISGSREAIWNVLADREKFKSLA